MKKELKRRLVAIMFTDMAGFTELMQRDEASGLQMRSRHKEVFQQQHAKYEGEIIQYFGDGTLSIFSNSNDAIECAISMQKDFQSPNKVPVRIGIHVGSVIVEKEGIIGDAVNIASRIESYANVGGILISDSVQDQVKNQSQYEFILLGKFHLKNVERLFEIYAVSAEGIQVPKNNFLKGKGEKVVSFKSHIPIPTFPILGRDKEVNDLISLLSTNQVVTITGTGGIGKTRLSLEICDRLKSEFRDGIAFVSMATITDATAVMPILTAALDVKEAPGRSLVNGVAALISDKKALLVLDNLEHVISAAEEIADLASKCPNLKILCTSRTPLKIKAEHEYALHPLLLPNKTNNSDLMDYPAIELFVNRAVQVNMDFSLTLENAESVLEICKRLDGLPLALELAAARIRILPPDRLLKRLNRALDVLTTGSKDLPERHQTLRTTIGWSYSLLEKLEQQLFRRLSVFAGGFTLEAVEAVCYNSEDDVFLAIDELESLVNKGLVENREGGKRFFLLQTINDFATEELLKADETALLTHKHAEYYLEFAKKLENGLMNPEQLKWMSLGALEDSNIQVSLDHLLANAKNGSEIDRESGLTICGVLWMYWHIRGKHESAKTYINSFLKASDDQRPSLGKCKSLLSLSVASSLLGEFQESKEQALHHYAMARQLSDEMEMAKSAFSTGFGYLNYDLGEAKKYSDEAVARFEKLRIDFWIGLSLWENGVINLVSGDLNTAKEKYSKSLDYADKSNDNEAKGGSLSGLAMIEVIGGNLDQAIDLYQKSLSTFESVGDRPEEARILSEISWVYLAKKNTRAARKYTLDSIQAYQEVGSMRGVGISMFGLAAIEAEEGRPKRAIEIAVSAEQLANQEGIVVEFGLNNQARGYLEKAKSELSEFEIEQAENVGKTLSLNEVLRLTEDYAILII